MTYILGFNFDHSSHTRQFLLGYLMLSLMVGVAVGGINAIVDMQLGKWGQGYDVVVFTNATINVSDFNLVFTMCNQYTFKINLQPQPKPFFSNQPTTLTLLTPVPAITSCSLGDDSKYLDIFSKTRKSSSDSRWELYDQNDNKLISWYSQYYWVQYRQGSQGGINGQYKEIEQSIMTSQQKNNKFKMPSCDDYNMLMQPRTDFTIDFSIILKQVKNRCLVDRPLNMLLSAKKYKSTTWAQDDLFLYNAKDQLIGLFQVNTW